MRPAGGVVAGSSISGSSRSSSSSSRKDSGSRGGVPPPTKAGRPPIPFPLRKGYWTPEESAYAACIIRHFKGGLLKIKPGSSLRSHLADLLHCSKQRISDSHKVCAAELSRKGFRPCLPTPGAVGEAALAKAERASLKRAFRNSVGGGSGGSVSSEEDYESRDKPFYVARGNDFDEMFVPPTALGGMVGGGGGGGKPFEIDTIDPRKKKEVKFPKLTHPHDKIPSSINKIREVFEIEKGQGTISVFGDQGGDQRHRPVSNLEVLFVGWRDPFSIAWLLRKGNVFTINELKWMYKHWRGEGIHPPVPIEVLQSWWLSKKLPLHLFPDLPDWDKMKKGLVKHSTKNAPDKYSEGKGRNVAFGKVVRSAIILFQGACANYRCKQHRGWDLDLMEANLSAHELDHLIPWTKSMDPSRLLTDFDLSKTKNLCFLREICGLRAVCATCHVNRYKWMHAAPHELAYPFKFGEN